MGGFSVQETLLRFPASTRGPRQPIFNAAIRGLLNKDDSEHISWLPLGLTVTEEHLPVAGRPGTITFVE